MTMNISLLSILLLWGGSGSAGVTRVPTASYYSVGAEDSESCSGWTSTQNSISHLGQAGRSSDTRKMLSVYHPLKQCPHNKSTAIPPDTSVPDSRLCTVGHQFNLSQQ